MDMRTTYRVQSKIARLEACDSTSHHMVGLIPSAGHFLSGLVCMPLLPGCLPFDQAIDFSDSFVLVNNVRV